MAAGTAALGSVGPVILVGASEAPPCLRFVLSPATRVPLALHVLLRNGRDHHVLLYDMFLSCVDALVWLIFFHCRRWASCFDADVCQVRHWLPDRRNLRWSCGRGEVGSAADVCAFRAECQVNQ